MIDIYQTTTSPARGFGVRVDTRALMQRIADQLRAVRTSAGLTQAELASRIGLSQPTISGAERGIPTTSDAVERWAEACGAAIVIAGGPAAAASADLAALSSDDLARVRRIALVLAKVPSETKDAVVAAFEALAAK
jgi:transcriptional regulator with XRE-family HTH domain